VRGHETLPEADGGRVFAAAEHGAAVSVVLIDAAPGEQQAPDVHQSRRSPNASGEPSSPDPGDPRSFRLGVPHANTRVAD
jgi:hypothetical protein